jgi:ribonuclease Z
MFNLDESMKLRRIALYALLLLVMAAGLAWLLREPISLGLASRMAVARLGADGVTGLPDGLHVGVCGAGSPFPDDRRLGPCTLVVAGTRLMVFDAGSGVRNLNRMGFNPGRVDAIFLTHFHSDHIDGLGELLLQRWVAGGHGKPVPLYGPPGVETVGAGLMQAYSADRGYRVEHHGDTIVIPSGFGAQSMPFQLGADGRVTVLRDGDLEVVAFTVEHSPVHPAVGYRIQYKGRTVVLSGDTRDSAAVRREAKGADLLVHEALSLRLTGLLAQAAEQAGQGRMKKIFGDITDYHASPEQAAETAREAGVSYLLLNHIVPTLPALPGMEAVFLGEAPRRFAGTLSVARDGDFLSLPAGTAEIRSSRRF